MTNDAFGLDALFHNSWNRYKTRIVKMVFTNLLVFGLSIVGFLALALIFGLIIGGGALLHSPFLYLLALPMGLIALVLMFYFFGWFGLASVTIVTGDDPKKGVWQNLIDARALAIPFVLYSLLSGLFMFGLWFTWILVVPLIVWSVWAAFSIFAFIYEERGGLLPLWRSKQIVKGSFWGVVGRFFTLWSLIFGISITLNMSRYTSPLTVLLQLLVFQPFSLCFSYEMYLALKKKTPVTVDKPKGGFWVYLSIAGWVIMVVGLFLFLGAIVAGIGNIYRRQPLFAPPSAQNQMKLVPTSAVTENGNKNAGRTFATLEEAFQFALTGSGMEHLDTTRVSEIKILYTPLYKQWKFTFVSQVNAHKSDPYSETLYDFPQTVIMVKNTGDFSLQTTTFNKNESLKTSIWSQLPTSSEVALTPIVDLAKQKVLAAGFQPGQIISAQMQAYPFSRYGTKTTWVVDVVLAGEEEKDQKKAKEITIEDGTYVKMVDTSLTISQNNLF